MENITVLRRIRSLQGKNVVLLFGKPRAGKSTFINDAYRKKVVESTTGITSDTNEISYVNEPIRIDDRDVFLVDTIGLGGSGKDHDRVSFALKWLGILYPGENRRSPLKPTIKGILYFIDIMDGAMNQDNIRNLEMFKALVGEEVEESVVFVTTKWATSAEKSTRRRLEQNFIGWREKIHQDFPKASILRLDDITGRLDGEDLNKLSLPERAIKEGGYHDNAMRVLRQLLTKTATQPILAQKEMFSGGKEMTAGQTTVGKTIIRHLSEDITGTHDKTIIERLKDIIQRLMNLVVSQLFSSTRNKKVRGGKNTASHELHNHLIVELWKPGDDGMSRPPTAK
ncbi:hypothetical protein DL96DRAFT_351590 [Flagelloscypha sp. PMI_526]|nr:hypothetical protein DL96DRAFT_351590 [Flagelloscypha sp. PMI_526]